MTWKREQIWLGCMGEPLMITASVNGALAVHRRVGRCDGPWTITHLGTGFRVCGAATETLAEAAADELLKLGDWGWAGTRGWENSFPDFNVIVPAWLLKNAELFRLSTNPVRGFSDGLLSDGERESIAAVAELNA